MRDLTDALGWLIAAGIVVGTGAWCRALVRVLRNDDGPAD